MGASGGQPPGATRQHLYGIGKSSLAGYLQAVVEAKFRLHPIYVQLGGAASLEDVAVAVVQGLVRSGAFHSTRAETIRNWLAKYVGKQELFGIQVNLAALRHDAPALSNPHGMLDLLGATYERIRSDNVRGIFLDEINGITRNEQFAHFIKGLVDENALKRQPLPLMLMLCGVEERRRDMIACHQPIDRIFDVVEIEAMTDAEMRHFFTRAFERVSVTVEAGAMSDLVHYSAGIPKIMHVIGDETFWVNNDGVIDQNDAFDGVIRAAEQIGKKYVDQQVYAALRSSDYHSILDKIGSMPLDQERFRKSELADNLNDGEARKLNNFLQKMKKLGVLWSGAVAGEYVFNLRMVRLYLWMVSQERVRGRIHDSPAHSYLTRPPIDRRVGGRPLRERQGARTRARAPVRADLSLPKDCIRRARRS